MEWISQYRDGMCAVYLSAIDAVERVLPQTAMRGALISTIGLCASLVADSALDSFVKTESGIAKAGLLANIGPDGSKSFGAAAGIVVASPNVINPDYLYSWVRDSSLVFKTLVDQYITGQDNSLRGLIDDFVSAESNIQQVGNPSGTVGTGGLGEPKFLINGKAFEGPWGRPQRDGPALRSTTLINYANWLLKKDNTTFVNDTLWPIIKLDLDYVAKYWNESTFDLWEEVFSSSFWTSSTQHRALRQGAALANALHQTSLSETYTKQADNILCFMQSYWNPSSSYMTSNTGGGRSGIDSNTVLASIHTFDPDAGCDAVTFQPCSDKALASLKKYVDSFRLIYSINSGIPLNGSVATGRYPEDVYFGGNPWYLTTAAVAEQLYDALYVWEHQDYITITKLSLPFFKQFSASVEPGNYASSTDTFSTLTLGIQTFADGFLAIVAKYTPKDGGLAEQFGKNDGKPLSAADLTWSYAAALTAFAARNGTEQQHTSWGAKDLVVPSVCRPYDGPAVPVTFKVVANTIWGENIYVTGSVTALGNWAALSAVPLNPSGYPTWTATVNVSTSTRIEYKYIRIFNGMVTWEGDPNNRLTTPQNGSANTDDTWRW